MTYDYGDLVFSPLRGVMNKKRQRRLQKLVNHLNKSIMRATQLMERDDTHPWDQLARELIDMKRRVMLAAWERSMIIDEEGLPK